MPTQAKLTPQPEEKVSDPAVPTFPMAQHNPCFFNSLCQHHNPRGCDYISLDEQQRCSNWSGNMERLAGRYVGRCVICRQVLDRRTGTWVVPDEPLLFSTFGATPGGVFCPVCRPKPNIFPLNPER